MKGIKTINKCLILFFLVLGKIAAQPCANAGKDSLVCGLTYNLVGSPTGGDWNYICNDTSYIVKLDCYFSWRRGGFHKPMWRIWFHLFCRQPLSFNRHSCYKI